MDGGRRPTQGSARGNAPSLIKRSGVTQAQKNRHLRKQVPIFCRYVARNRESLVFCAIFCQLVKNIFYLCHCPSGHYILMKVFSL